MKVRLLSGMKGRATRAAGCPGVKLIFAWVTYKGESLVHDPCLPMGHIEAQKSGKKSERDMETGKISSPFLS